MTYHGNPCWYELGTSDLNGAGQFYGKVLGWNVENAGMEGFEYHLAKMGEAMVAGMMSNAGQEGSPPPNWVIYFAVDDCDKTAADVKAGGGQVYKEPADIPGTGRFAVVADPQGAVFGILQPLPMTPSDEGQSFNQQKAGHGNWNELMSSDPEAAYDFYAKLFGWSKGEAMDMGEMGTYQLLRRDDKDFGAVMGLGDAPVPAWLPYFGVENTTAAVDRINAEGGKVLHGPIEVPGPAWIAVAQDPQGAAFAVVGPEK